MGAGGRPSKFKPEYCPQATKLCRLGATDADLADFFEVNEDTINEWKKVHPKFSESLKDGKAKADAEVADKLFQRATGYSHEAVKIFCDKGETFEHKYTEHYPPDPTSCIFWLKNRRPDLWRDRIEALTNSKPASSDEVRELTEIAKVVSSRLKVIA